MSITAIPAAKTATQTDNSVTAKILSLISMLAQQNGTQGLSSIFGANNNLGIQGYQDILGANSNSIFGKQSNSPALPDNVANLLGFQSYGANGSPLLDNKSLTSLSSAEEEKIVANATASTVSAILSMKIPPIPKKENKKA